MNHNLNNYKKVEAETTDPIKLIIMLYEGAINFTEQAKLRLIDKKMADKGILITKVLAIVDELQSSLNLQDGGEFAVNMDRIYTYIRDRLMEANSNNNVTILSEMINHFRVLKNAWVKAHAKVNKENAQEVTVQPVQDPPQLKSNETYPLQTVTTEQPNPPATDAEGLPAIEVMG